jgi:hypothetical protein
MRAFLAAAFAVALAGPALAEPLLLGRLAPLSFMLGDWRGLGNATGAGAGGDSAIHADLGGRMLIRRDHVLTRQGGALDLYMAVYDDAGRLRADFLDTEGHVIHYTATPGPGPSAVFEAPGSAQAPGFRLSYAAAGPDRLHIRFEIAPPGGALATYSEGDVARR